MLVNAQPPVELFNRVDRDAFQGQADHDRHSGPQDEVSALKCGRPRDAAATDRAKGSGQTCLHTHAPRVRAADARICRSQCALGQVDDLAEERTLQMHVDIRWTVCLPGPDGLAQRHLVPRHA
jgi:hypothetical protein